MDGFLSRCFGGTSPAMRKPPMVSFFPDGISRFSTWLSLPGLEEILSKISKDEPAGGPSGDQAIPGCPKIGFSAVKN